MIEIDLIKKHGKKIMGMEEHAPHKLTFRERIPEILLEICIIVFAISLSIWLHNWQEHRHNRAREQQFLRGVQQDLNHDIVELRGDSLSYVRQLRGMRYFRGLRAATLSEDSVKAHRWVLTSSTWFVPNDSRFEGLKSSGALGIIENETLLNDLLTYYQRTTVNLTLNAKGYGEVKLSTIRPYLDLHLQPGGANLVAVMQQTPMQNYLSYGESIGGILTLYHETAQQARQLRRRIAAYLANE